MASLVGDVKIVSPISAFLQHTLALLKYIKSPIMRPQPNLDSTGHCKEVDSQNSQITETESSLTHDHLFSTLFQWREDPREKKEETSFFSLLFLHRAQYCFVVLR